MAPKVSFTLAAGYYVVRSHYHDASSDLAMLVEPAVNDHYTVDLYAATVVGRAVAASGASANDVKWQVVRSTPEPDGTHHVVATNSGANPTFLVREGNYLVIATGADGSVGEAPLAVVAGRTHQVKVIRKRRATATVKTSTVGLRPLSDGKSKGPGGFRGLFLFLPRHGRPTPTMTVSIAPSRHQRCENWGCEQRTNGKIIDEPY